MKYACIEENRPAFSVSLMCRVLEVSRSGFYASRTREPSERDREDARLRLHVRAVYRKSRQTYGSPRVHAELRAEGIRCGRKRVERLMREDELQARVRKRWRGSTTDSSHAYATALNLVDRRFDVEEIASVDRVWAGDITYLPTRQGWLYLAVVLDLKSRMVVGWSMQETLRAGLATDALGMALGRRQPRAGLIHHSDRGVQYASSAYRDLLSEHAIACSMSGKGDCWDNAVAESFFATLEWELIERSDWHTHAEARRAIFEYIECWYNRQRRHSSLGYTSPAEYEDTLALTKRAA